MTKLTVGGQMANRRLLCMFLALMCLCTSMLVHSHGCLEDADTMHAHHCTDDCCIACAFRNLIICALLYFYGRVAVRRMIGYRMNRRGAPPEKSKGTLVQLKVKLSN